MTGHLPRRGTDFKSVPQIAHTRRSTSGPGDGRYVVPGAIRLVTAAMASLALILIMQFIAASLIYADDRKTRVISFLSSGIKTAATAQSTGFDVSAYKEGQIFIDVTVEAGTSTLDVTIQTSPDNATWYTHTTVGQITAIGQTRTAVTNFGNYLRINYVVGGTSFTFSVTGVFKN